MRRSGFTLIELLVVIAIIIMLVSILLPILRAGKQRARAVTCGSNIKQLVLTLSMYAQENQTFPYGFDDSTLLTAPPPAGGYPGNAAYDRQGWWWFNFLDNILEENFEKGSVFWCPSRCVKGPGPKENILCGNYGVNRVICKDAPGVIGGEFVGTPLGLHQIHHPARTLLIVDGGYSLISWRGATNAPDRPFENARREGTFYVPGLWINRERTLFPGHELDAINGRHPNKSVNVGFADSHVNRVKADNLFVGEIDGSYNNRSPLWLPK